jgi:hypothetical protein
MLAGSAFRYSFAAQLSPTIRRRRRSPSRARGQSGIDDAALAVVHTGAYASRVWCQHEIIRAKRRGRPVVVIHAIEEGEARSFPYIGNVPTIRWRAGEPGRTEAVVGLVLHEVLRAEYFQQHFEDLRALFGVPDAVRALPRAPELLTGLALRAETAKVPYFVYPDPPLAAQEVELLTELDPSLRLTTPTFLFANPTQPLALTGESLTKAAAGWRVGISISNSPDLALRGFGLPKLAGEQEAPPPLICAMRWASSRVSCSRQERRSRTVATCAQAALAKCSSSWLLPTAR